MLQQTQVRTVIPYYQRFLQAFPTFERLARAPLDKVLEVWSGMGYYRRARHLHRAAQVIAERWGGSFPNDYRVARSLPGVGDYTARAVLSIAYRQPYAVLDGNVARVAARVRALAGNLNQRAFRRKLEPNLAAWLSRSRPGNTNQALMELGQTVCLARVPRCPVCPLQKWCLAYARKKSESYPQPKPRRPNELHHLAVAVIRRRRRFAMVRGLDEGLLADMWNFPSAFGRSRAKALRRLREKLAAFSAEPIGVAGPLGDLRHQITHRAIQVRLYPARAGVKPPAGPFRWFRAAELRNAAASKLARKVAASLVRQAR